MLLSTWMGHPVYTSVTSTNDVLLCIRVLETQIPACLDKGFFYNSLLSLNVLARLSVNYPPNTGFGEAGSDWSLADTASPGKQRFFSPLLTSTSISDLPLWAVTTMEEIIAPCYTALRSASHFRSPSEHEYISPPTVFDLRQDPWLPSNLGDHRSDYDASAESALRSDYIVSAGSAVRSDYVVTGKDAQRDHSSIIPQSGLSAREGMDLDINPPTPSSDHYIARLREYLESRYPRGTPEKMPQPQENKTSEEMKSGPKKRKKRRSQLSSSQKRRKPRKRKT